MKKDGYMFISLLIITSLMGVLSVSFTGMVIIHDKRHKEEDLRFSLIEIQDSIDYYEREKGTFPANLDDLIKERYLRREYRDPFIRQGIRWRDSWSYDNKSGVVKSKSKGSSLKGNSYKEWTVKDDGGKYIISETGE